MTKKILSVLFLLSISFISKAQLHLVAGIGTGLYESKYIMDDTLTIDLKDYHSLAFNYSPHFVAGIDIGNRVRFTLGLSATSRNDKADWSYLVEDSLLNPATDYSVVIKNQYYTIPINLTFNLVGKDSKSRLPIGLGADINMLNKQVITSSSLESFGNVDLPKTYTKEELDSVYNTLGYSVSFNIGYGYRFNDHLGLDALLFAKYDLTAFNKLYPLYNNYASVGLNLTLYYVFGESKDE